MSKKSDIQFRMNMLDHESKMHAKFKLTALERSRKLKSLDVTEGKIKARISTLEAQKKQVQSELDEAYSQQNRVATEKREIDKIKSPIITEHALLRYVERFWGVDLEKAHEEILLLPESEKIKAKNTIVTVFPDPEDNFNLAERESQ